MKEYSNSEGNLHKKLTFLEREAFIRNVTLGFYKKLPFTTAEDKSFYQMISNL